MTLLFLLPAMPLFKSACLLYASYPQASYGAGYGVNVT